MTLALLLLSILAHEYAHAAAALMMGDRTALERGRLGNPLRHVDPFWTLAVPCLVWLASGGHAIAGAARPLPVDPRRYRRRRAGMLVVSLAGVALNGAIALAAAALGWSALRDVNLWLAAVNLLPVPPLDGWRALDAFRR